MDYKAIWNDICFHVNKNRDSTEQDFQKTVELLFEKLGWSAAREEIYTQIEVPVGSSNSYRPDIVIKNDGEMIYVVELKRVNVNISERNADQLISYMRLLRLNYGVLFGESLRIYCELPSTKKSPVRICDILFVKDSVPGIECIEVLSKPGFSFDRFNDFTEKCLSDSKRYCEKRVSPDSMLNNTGSREDTYSSKSSNYGKEKKGLEIYSILCEHDEESFWVGKRDILGVIDKMSKNELANTKFWLNDRSSQKSSSWITGKKFKILFEEKI